MEQGSYVDRFVGKNMATLMREAIEMFPDRDLFGVKVDGVYRWQSYRSFGERMERLRAVFRRGGFGYGDRVAIIAKNSEAFALTVYAAYGLGGIVVPMYEVQKESDWAFILADSQPKIAVVSTDDIREKIERIANPSLEHIYVVSPENPQADNGFEHVIATETERADIAEGISDEDISDIIYTSGTTGMPHGVELTHRNIVNDFTVAARLVPFYKEDRSLSFLPWAHAFGKIVELHLIPFCGGAVALAESPRTVADNLLEVQPTILVSVPKIFNKIYDVVHLRVEHKRAARALLRQMEDLSKASYKGRLPLAKRLQLRLLERLIGKKVRAAFGGKLRFSLSGGASLSPEVAAFFMGCGVTVYEGYGMTEHSPVVAVNTPADTKIGTVGKPLPGVKVDILRDTENGADDERCGEIVLSSASVMKGYHNDPQANAAAFDEEGRFHTGDMGYLDDDGFLVLTGRVKEQYKLENGKYVVPSVLEEKINTSLKIAQSVVFGSGKAYNIALINPTQETIEQFRHANHLEAMSTHELAEYPAFRALFADELKEKCDGFRGYERPQKFALILEEFTIDNGLLTPALKIKRREIERRFADTIDALYQ